MARNTAVWRPTPVDPPPTGHLPDELAHLLNTWLNRDGIWCGEGKPRKDEPLQIEATPATLGFLEGLAAMQVQGAHELIVALNAHENIDIWWE